MGMKSLLSIGERLEKLLEEAEKEADAKIAEAKKKTEEMVTKAKTEAERRRAMAQRGTGIDELLREAEKKAMREANKTMEDFEGKAEEMKAVHKEKFEESVALVIREVLPE